MTGPGMGSRCHHSSSQRLVCSRRCVRSWPPHPACLCYQSCCYLACGPLHSTLSHHRDAQSQSSTRPGATSSIASVMSPTAGASAGTNDRCCHPLSPQPAPASFSSLRSSVGHGSFHLVQSTFPSHRHPCCSMRAPHYYLHHACCPHCHLVVCLEPEPLLQLPLSTSWPFLQLRTRGN